MLERAPAPSVVFTITLQQRIGSGFGAATTAAEILAGLDLTGTLAIVTGGYSGIGLEATRMLSGAGAHVVVPARRPAGAEEALAGISRVEVAELDLAELDSVRAFADRFLASGRGIDVFIGGAGIVVVSSRGHHLSGIRWDDVRFESGYEKWAAYGQSKTANVLFAVHLDVLARERGVRAFALDPGRLMTQAVTPASA